MAPFITAVYTGERVKAKIRLYAKFIKPGCRDKERDHVDNARRLDHTLRTSFFNELAKRLVFDALDFHASTDRRHECACQLMIDTAGARVLAHQTHALESRMRR